MKSYYKTILLFFLNILMLCLFTYPVIAGFPEAYSKLYEYFYELLGEANIESDLLSIVSGDLSIFTIVLFYVLMLLIIRIIYVVFTDVPEIKE